MKRRLVASAVLILLIGLGAKAGYSRLAALKAESQRSSEAQPPPLVRVETARSEDYREILRGYGRAEPLRRTQVVAEVAGVVTAVTASLEAGASIAAADGVLPVLVRLDDRDLADQLARTESEAAMAEADTARLKLLTKSLQARLAVVQEELDAAQREFRRVASLVPKTLSKSDLDAQRIQVSVRQRQTLLLESQALENAEALNAARAQIEVRARQVALARRQLERTIIRAPFAGRIEQRQVQLGGHVRVGDPLFTIVDLSRVEVPVALAAARYSDVRDDAHATARLPETTAILWEGKISRVAPAINPTNRTFFAYVVLTGSPTSNPAAPGAHLLVTVEGRLFQDVIPVPRRAFLGDRLFVAGQATADGQAIVEERRPEIVRLLPGVALVRRGLKAGELYLVTNLESVANGSKVRMAPDEKAALIGDTER